MVTEEECIRALQRASERLGKSPTKVEYERLKVRPAAGTIIRVIGGWNAAKQAAGLKTYRRGEKGGTPIQKQPDDVEIPDEYEWAELNPQQRWYYKNRERRLAVKNRRKKELRDWYLDYKARHCACEVCGESHPACIDFHHLSEKEMEVSQMVNHGFSKENILAEIDSCRTLCSNCHRKEHFQEFKLRSSQN